MLCSDGKDKKARSKLLTFLLVTLFMVALSVLLFEITLTRIFSIVLWYDYAFMTISVAFSGLGIGALRVYILKDKLREEEELPSKIIQSTIAFAISVPLFLFVMGHIIPPNTSLLYLFYLVSSIPFFFAGMSMAEIYLTMSREISRLYFADLSWSSYRCHFIVDLLSAAIRCRICVTFDIFIDYWSFAYCNFSVIHFASSRKKIVPSNLPIIEKSR